MLVIINKKRNRLKLNDLIMIVIIILSMTIYGRQRNMKNK